MRWPSPARLGDAWREVGWPLGIPAVLSAVWLAVMPVYLARTFYAFALAEPQQFLADYSFFHEAALRFFADPATLYADPEYFYPPPGVLVFWPTTLVGKVPGYILSGPIIFATLAVAVVWALRLWEQERGEPLGTATRASLIVIALGSTATFQSLKYAQVNGLVLVSAVAFLALCQRERPGWAALALAGGFWLKLLPLVLLPLGLGARWRQLAAGTLVGFIALPLALLPLVPAELYHEYARDRLPHLSGLTDWSALNGSIPASITRLGLPIEVVRHSGMLPATPLASALAAVVGMLVIGAATLAVWTRRVGIVRGGAVVLGVLPAVVPLGWEHTYALALPLLLLGLTEAGRLTVAGKVLVFLCALAFFAQRPPPPMMAELAEALPRACIDLYLARLWLAVLVLTGVVLGPARRTLQSSLPIPL